MPLCSVLLVLSCAGAISIFMEFTDLGFGKCLIDGHDPKFSYHGDVSDSACQDSCEGQERCYGYSESSAGNCIHWEEAGLTGGGNAWGGAHCIVKGPRGLLPSPPAHPLVPLSNRHVILCSGLGDFDESKLSLFTANCADYQQKRMITHVSTLLYGISDAGALVRLLSPLATSGPDYTYQKLGKGGLGLGVLPTIFCDGTLPNTCNVPTCLNAAMQSPESLFNASAAEAQKYGWEGYMIDMEGGYENYNTLIDQWGDYLHQRDLKLYVWNRMVDVAAAAVSSSVDGVISMDTYGANAWSFKWSASAFLKSVPASKAGLGLITYDFPNTDVDEVGNWCDQHDVAQIVIWSDQQIPSSWNSGLQRFLDTPTNTPILYA